MQGCWRAISTRNLSVTLLPTGGISYNHLRKGVTMIRQVSLQLLIFLSLFASEDLPMLPSSSQWAVHCSVAELRGTELGSWVQELAAQGQIAARLRLLKAVSGLDVLDNIDSFTLYGPSDKESEAVVHIRGALDPVRT